MTAAAQRTNVREAARALAPLDEVPGGALEVRDFTRECESQGLDPPRKGSAAVVPVSAMPDARQVLVLGAESVAGSQARDHRC